ncbi:MAG: hypothetical protein ABIQ66_02250 [Novosphingobium sp.]
MKRAFILPIGVAISAFTLSLPGAAQQTPTTTSPSTTTNTPMSTTMPTDQSSVPDQTGQTTTGQTTTTTQASPYSSGAMAAAPSGPGVYPPCSATLQDECTNTRPEADYKASTHSRRMRHHKRH